MSIMCETMSNKLCWATTVIVRASDGRDISVDNLFSRYCLCGPGNAKMKRLILRPWKVAPCITYPFKYFEEYLISPDKKCADIEKNIRIHKALYHPIPKSTLNFHKVPPVSLSIWPNSLYLQNHSRASMLSSRNRIHADANIREPCSRRIGDNKKC